MKDLFAKVNIFSISRNDIIRLPKQLGANISLSKRRLSLSLNKLMSTMTMFCPLLCFHLLWRATFKSVLLLRLHRVRAVPVIRTSPRASSRPKIAVDEDHVAQWSIANAMPAPAIPQSMLGTLARWKISLVTSSSCFGPLLHWLLFSLAPLLHFSNWVKILKLHPLFKFPPNRNKLVLWSVLLTLYILGDDFNKN